MIGFFKYIAIFLLGFLLAKLWYEKKIEKTQQKEEIQVVLNGIKNLRKLVVSQGSFSEMYHFLILKNTFMIM
ncbi:hypothetical protein AUW17_10935 [Tenacibaculum dicentrarchi]|nr:hypothetical protein AUW17_10935 [Tenacibaculum dicentrarchi]